MSEKNQYVIETKDLNKIYKTHLFGRPNHVLKDLNLEVKEGEIYGFIGPNGAGKTTTIKILVNLLYPSSGKAYILGQDTRKVEIKKKIGFLPENPYFYEYLKPREFLYFYGRLFGYSTKEIKEKADRLLELVGLENVDDVPLCNFSRGMLQRIGIAQALINDPLLVIFDEPLSGLDPIGRKDVKDILLSLKEQGKTVFFSTHILADVEMICDRVGILINGKLVRVGSLSDFLEGEIRSIDIVLSDVGAETQEVIKKVVTKYLIKDKKIFISVNSEEETSEIQRILSKNSGRILSIVPHSKTLEDYFSSLVISTNMESRSANSSNSS